MVLLQLNKLILWQHILVMGEEEVAPQEIQNETMADKEGGLGASHPRSPVHLGPKDHALVTKILIHFIWNPAKPQAISFLVDEVLPTIVGNHGQGTDRCRPSAQTFSVFFNQIPNMADVVTAQDMVCCRNPPVFSACFSPKTAVMTQSGPCLGQPEQGTA